MAATHRISADGRLGAPATDSLVVTSTSAVAKGVVSLVLRRPDGGRLPDWTPGSHIDLVLPDGTTRQYSLCGDPRRAHEYRIAVLREANGRGGSRFLHDDIHEGDLVSFGGPRNNFRLTPSPSFDFVAGGIGITPILPMLRAATELGARWRLLYLGRDRAGMSFLDEVADHGDAVRIHPSAELGPADLAEWVGDFDGSTKLYACGPTRLTDAVAALAQTRRPGWTRVERFSASDLGEPARTTPFDVEVAGTGRTIRVAAGVAIADALRGAGFDVLTSCSRGVCGTCETRVLSGTPDHRDSILNDVERASGDCFFPCVSRSRSDRLVLAL